MYGFQIQLFDDGVKELGHGAIRGHKLVSPEARQLEGLIAICSGYTIA